MQAALAGLPILLILFLMLALRWPAARAGAAGLLVTMVLAWTAFDTAAPATAQGGALNTTAGSLFEALFIALTVLWIIFPALCIYELQSDTGALESLRAMLASLAPDPRSGAILIAWFFALFMEGAAGFGTSAALAAPFLVSMGIPRIDAVCIALVGHAAGVSFGAVGTPVIPQAAVTPFGLRELASATAVYHTVLGVFLALAVVVLLNRSRPAPGGLLRGWRLAMIAAFAFLLPYALLAFFTGPELPTLGGAVIGAVFFVLWLLRRRPDPGLGARGSDRGSLGIPPQSMPPLKAAAPYLILIMLVLTTRLIPGVAEFLRALQIRWTWDEFSGQVAPLYHPGSLLFTSFLVAALWQRASQRHVRQAMGRALKRLVSVTFALLFMLGLSRLMLHSGMIDTLAQAAAVTLGSTWPLFVPFIGALGTFITGSATASNILFTEFQFATANRLGFPALPLLGAQGFGAAVGNLVCPHNIIAANAVVSISGNEGAVLKRTAGVMLIYTALGGALALLLAQ